MRAVWQLIKTYILVSVRVPIAFFVNLLLPLGFFVLYASLLSHGSRAEVDAIVARLVCFGALSSALFGLIISLVGLREQHILRRLHLCPISPVHVIVSRILANYALFLVALALELAIAGWYLHANLGSNVFAAVVVFSLGYLAIAALGFVIASIVNTVQEAQLYTQIVFFLFLIMSGIAVSLQDLPLSLERIAPVFPSTLMVVAGTGILSHDAGIGVYWPEVVSLLVVIAVGISLATALFRWESGQRISARDRLTAAISIVPLIAIGIWLNSVGFLQQILKM